MNRPRRPSRGDQPTKSSSVARPLGSTKKHRVLIVDDEDDVHAITRLSLRGLRYRERKLEFLSVMTGRDAVETMRRYPDIAVILLDVVMESDHAGLHACRAIRDELANPFVRILLRTGQAGVAPEKKVIEEYDIDGYLAKGELTSMRLYTAVRTSLKAYGELMDLEAVVAERTREIQRQKAENERLLLSILPAAIAERVRSGELRGRFESPEDAFGGPQDAGGGAFDIGALMAYLPMDRRQAMARSEELAENTEGAALFADVTGFTPLTEVLARELGTRRGAEELASQLDRVYGALIGEVHRQRGSVIGFSGDAVTCWFDGDDGRRAVACAVNMQRVMGWFAAIETPSGSILPLAIKVAVTRGPVRRLLVGDPKIQLLDLLAGATIDRLEVASSLAHQGEVVVGPRIIEALGARLHLSSRHPGGDTRFGIIAGLTRRIADSPWPALAIARDQMVASNLRRWLLPAIYRRLTSSQGQFLAELRTAVALFLHFDSLGIDHEKRARADLDRYVCWVQRTVVRHGGALIQLTTGDKGSYLYATFGAPTAYEDEIERGFAAALALRLPPAELPSITGVRIGLSRGRMRAGECGSETRRTYGVLGDETNVAARLMDKASPGQVLTTESMALAAASRFRFRKLGAVSIRGKQHPLPIVEVLGRRRARQLKPTAGSLIGRGRERRLLQNKLTELVSGSSNTVLIQGEAGIGKSCLISDLIGWADGLQPEVLTFLGSGESLEQATPYHAWRPILRDLLEGGEQESSFQTFLNLESHEFRAGHPEVGDMLLHHLRLSAENRQLLIVLENAQWLDSDSWSLALRAQLEIRPLLLVIAMRPLVGEIHGDIRRLTEHRDVLQLSLEPLSRQQTLTLVSRRLGVDDLPQAVATWIREKAGGHPGFGTEVADALAASGRIAVEDGNCRVTDDLSSLDLPEVVERVVMSTIDALEPGHQLVLKVASVVGRTFTADILYAVYPVAVDQDHLARAFAALEHLRLITREPDETKAVYAFRHPAIQNVAYHLLLHTQRRQLHRQIAEWNERRHAGGLEPYYPLLAHHWLKALEEVEQAEPRLVTKAIDYLADAGDQALRGTEHSAAVEHFRRGLELLESLPRSIERDYRELELRLALETGLNAASGDSPQELARNQHRVNELQGNLEQSGRIPRRFIEQAIDPRHQNEDS